jgi:hypothetical protein
MTTTDLQAMRGHTPTGERTWGSTALDRRIMLAKVPMLPDADLRGFRLELQEASISIRDQIELKGEGADPDWVWRARSKQRIVRLFIVACGEEAERRLAAMSLERARLKTARTLQANDEGRKRLAKRAKVIQGLLVAEWGAERTAAFYDRASTLADELIAQEQAQP